MVDQARLTKKVEGLIDQLEDVKRVLQGGHPTVTRMNVVLEILESVVDGAMAIEIALED